MEKIGVETVVETILFGVPNIKDGRSYRYAIDDVAKKIYTLYETGI